MADNNFPSLSACLGPNVKPRLSPRIKATSDVTTARPMYHHLRLPFRPCLCESLTVLDLVFRRELGTLDSGVLGVAVAACPKGLGIIERATRIRAPTVNVVHVVDISSKSTTQIVEAEVSNLRANEEQRSEGAASKSLCSSNRDRIKRESWEEGKHLGNVGAAESPWLVLRVPGKGISCSSSNRYQAFFPRNPSVRNCESANQRT